MSGLMLTIGLPLAALYVVFLVWYRGSGRPLALPEKERYLSVLRTNARDEEGLRHVAEVERLLEHDDGREFVMHNVIRYRKEARYPPGYDYGPSAPAADRRYGKAIVPYLLRYGNVPVFIAKRSGRFVEPEGVDCWDVVAMVRYRSLRDFLRFATAITQDRIVVHKWAAIENTQIFPVRPLVSLIFVRGAVGVALAAIGALLLAVGRLLG
jgi:hypothetical protein